ncbi:DUF1624 domain-containing protein [uncultured Aquabacterium sp.]|uniref:DUF1624 domain-containing protein n=1 Tax=Aquabacterium sp. TaxID=1872578 RepID=UPI0025D35711|nr:heparan-alpha-glucosaminide N-acetyltransferase [uncultured Aquabacterium sp.]
MVARSALHPLASPRFDRLDRLRGLALLWMAAFHFCFDLANWRLIQANFYADPLWTTQRTCILSLFLLCAGAGQAIAVHQGQTWARFWRRWAQVAGCALLVTLGSMAMFPRSFIYFGVLHGMAVMLLVARLTAGWGRGLWVAGAVAIVLPHVFQHPVFDAAWLDWTGLMTRKPITEDHVPLLPWLGVMWWGLAATQWMLAHRPGWLQGSDAATRASGDNTHPAQTPLFPRVLSTLGRWSLTFYMVHQPLLIGALAAWMTLTGRAIPA